MFIGHFAIGLAARKVANLPSLAMLFIAVQFLDLIWPIFVLLGIEHLSIDPGNTAITPLNFEYYPYSHSLMMAVIWGLILALVYWLLTKNKRGSWLLAGLVFSHWVLDLITHRPDLPISPFSDMKLGLGLWNYPSAAIVVELTIFLLGAFVYFKAGKPPRRIAYWALIVFLLAIHIINLSGPPPPSIAAVAWSANLMWIIILWAWWVEREKKVAAPIN